MTSSGWGWLRRFGVYAALTLVPVVWLGLVLARTVTTESNRAALREGGRQAESLAQTAIEPFLHGSPIGAGLVQGERVAIVLTTGNLLRHNNVLVFRLRDNEGRVMFDASDPNGEPWEPTVDQEVKEAVADGTNVVLTRVGADAVDHRRNPSLAKVLGREAVEAYVPLHARTQAPEVIGVAEIYIDYGPIADARAASIHRLLTTIIAGLAALWLVLGGIVASVSFRIKRHSRFAEQMALHDQLTGLPGRAIYADRVNAAIAAAGRMGTDVALVVVDIDHFKEVNDTLGHKNGDDLLKLVASRIAATLRPGDSIARLGGDEFGIVLPGVRSDTVEIILRRVQDAVAQEAELGGVAVSIDVSMGYAIWPVDADEAEPLLQRADLALHTAKATRAAIVRYHSGIDEFDPQRLGLIAELRRAIAADELVLHYQPKIDARSGQVVAFEALVRWMHPTRGLMAPNDFIPIAESTGLIIPLTRWVLDRALAQLAEWTVQHPNLCMAVNISARNLREELPGQVIRGLAAHGLKPARLQLELTETSFATDPVRATALLEELNAAGVRVSLDDFGQGYTSLGSLGHLPVSELKIDSGFVLAMEASSEDRAIVASVIELGHQLGLTVVAEGVETEAVAADLRQLGVDTMQGYLFSRPVPASAALELIDRFSIRV